MKTFREFLPYFMGDLHGCPRPDAESMVRRVLVEFLERSLVLEKDANKILVQSDKHTYTPVFPSNMYRAVSIIRARFTDDSGNAVSELTTTHWDDMENLVGPSWDRQIGGSEPSRIILTLDNKFRLYPVPGSDSSNDLNVLASVTITRDATEIDDYVFENFVEDVANGCRFYFMKQPNKPWTSPMYSSYEAEYWQGIRDARKQTLGGKGETSGYVKPRSFFNIYGAY